jgi:hypothetical protein
MNLRYLSMSQLAENTGIDRRTVKSRLAAVKPYRIDGKAIIYDAHQVLPILLGFGRSSKEEIETEMKDYERRQEKAKAEKLEIEVAITNGSYVATAEVARAVAAEYANVRARLTSIPSRCAKDLSLEFDPALVKSRLDQEVSEALSELTADETYEEMTNVEQLEATTEDHSTEVVEAASETELS